MQLTVFPLWGSREGSRLGQPVRHGFAQGGVDAGLPALPGGFEGFEHVGIHAHVQGRTLHGCGGPAPASLDAGLLPIGG